MLTFKDQKIVLFALEEADELDDTRVIDTSHDLNLFEDVCSLLTVSVLFCLVGGWRLVVEEGGWSRNGTHRSSRLKRQRKAISQE